MIVACSTCHHLFKTHYTEVQTVSLWELLDQVGLPSHDMAAPADPVVTVHDPCTSRHFAEMQGSIRELLRRLGYDIEELKLGREMTECCGFGGLMSAAAPALATQVAVRRAHESDLRYVTYCAMCRDALRAVGKNAVHILDIVFKGQGAWDTAGKTIAGYSQRRENRSRLKYRLARNVFGEEVRTMEGSAAASILIPTRRTTTHGGEAHPH